MLEEIGSRWDDKIVQYCRLVEVIHTCNMLYSPPPLRRNIPGRSQPHERAQTKDKIIQPEHKLGHKYFALKTHRDDFNTSGPAVRILAFQARGGVSRIKPFDHGKPN